MDILARTAEQPVGAVPGLAIVIVVGLVVTVLTAMSRNIANGRTSTRQLDRAERVGRSRMQDALHEAVLHRLAELPPEPPRRPSIDLTSPIDLTADEATTGTGADAVETPTLDLTEGHEPAAAIPPEPESD